MNPPSPDRYGPARRARFLQQVPEDPPRPGHRAVNFVIFLTIISLGAWIIYGGSWWQVLLATVVIVTAGLAFLLAERFHDKKRLRQMREETDRKRDDQFGRGPFDWHGEP